MRASRRLSLRSPTYGSKTTSRVMPGQEGVALPPGDFEPLEHLVDVAATAR
jgi:hypothetical protein